MVTNDEGYMKGGECCGKVVRHQSAQGGTRTHTLFGSDFESDASTNSTTRANVPMAGLEPARPCGQRILSPLRLPIPSHGLTCQISLW